MAKEKGVGLLARVPLASGLLTGKFTKESRFAEDDHRNYNRDGAHFNVGETFAGLPLRKAWNSPTSSAGSPKAAVLWPGRRCGILHFDPIELAIPGFKTVAQVEENVAAVNTPPFSDEELKGCSEFYHNEVKQYIRGPY